ncbi:MAG: hypothetical protein ABJF16_07475 [Lentilitoribacter sp.]
MALWCSSKQQNDTIHLRQGSGLQSLGPRPLSAFLWQFYSNHIAKKQRKNDQKWLMFKEEVYTPFRDLLEEFENVVRPTVLPNEFAQLSIEQVSERIGEFFTKQSEIEVMCLRADRHQNAQETRFELTYEQKQTKLDTKLGILLKSGPQHENACSSVGSAYTDLIDLLRDELTKARTGLDK